VLDTFAPSSGSEESWPVLPAARTAAAPAGTAPSSSPGLSRSLSDRLDGKVLLALSAGPEVVEHYRNLAAQLHQAQVDRDVKVVMVTSAVSGEGKTSVAINLALTLSESYRRKVLLVDADLRRPRMHDVFDLPASAGLNDALRDGVAQNVPVFEVSPRLSVLPAGRPDSDPMGILTSAPMARIVGEARSGFDWVLLDTPPVIQFPDTHLLAAMADVTLVVVHAGRTPAGLIARAIDTLTRQQVVGVVLNGVAEKESRPGSGYRCSYQDLGAEGS
jgi:capsular exopolysaccharide synthesis family protein